VGARHFSGIPDLKMAARTSTIAFFDAEGLVHHEFLPQRQTMNQTVFILQRLLDAVRRKLPHKCSSGLLVFCTATMRHATRP
jgi:hypothetical protein